MNYFHFLRPYWLLALIPLAVLFRILLHYATPENVWKKVCDPHLLPHLLVGQWQKQRQLPLFLLFSGWFIGIIALAGPTWSRVEAPVFQSIHATVIALDLSQQMFAQDIQPNRLVRAKFKVRDLLKNIKEGQVGMLAFTKESFLVSPLTDDSNNIAQLVQELDPAMMPVQGSQLRDVLTRSAELITNAQLHNGHVILITGAQPVDQDFQTIAYLHQQGIKVSILGIGTENGAPVPSEEGFMRDSKGNVFIARLDDSALARLAKAGGGIYVKYRPDQKDIDALINETQGTIGDHEQKTMTTKTQQWFDQGQNLVLLLSIIAAFAFRRGWMESLLQL